MFGGSSTTGNTVATLATDNLTVTGTTSVTGADYDKNFIATNSSNGLVQTVGTTAVIYPIGTASASRAVSLQAGSGSGNIHAYSDHSTISLTNKTKNPVVSAEPHPNYDYTNNQWIVLGDK